MRRAKMIKIRSRQDCDAIKVFETAKVQLSKHILNNHKNNRFTASK